MPGRSSVAHRRGNLGKTFDPTQASSFTVIELIGFPSTTPQGVAFVGLCSLPAHHGCHAQLPNKRARHMPSTTDMNILETCGDSVRDVLGCAFKQLGFLEPSTLRLALHCFDRINQHPTLAMALGATRVSYGIVTLWLAAKLEEKRGGIIGSQRVAQVVGTTAKAVAAMELQIFQLLDWSPYRGYVPQDELLVFL